MIYPIPTWEEREYNPSYYTTMSEKVLIAITAALIFGNLLLIVFVVVKRLDTFIKAANPLFLVCVLIGSCILLSTNFAW